MVGLGGCKSPPWVKKKKESPAPVGPAAVAALEDEPSAWRPMVGRMGPELVRRHLPSDAGWQAVFEDAGEGVEGDATKAWRVEGPGTVETVEWGGERGVLFRSGEAGAAGAIERELAPPPFTRARLEIDLLCRSTAALEAVRRTRIQLAVSDRGGQRRGVDLPLVIERSPGWETHAFGLVFAPTIDRVTLRITAERPGAEASVGRIRLMCPTASPEGRMSPAGGRSGGTRSIGPKPTRAVPSSRKT